VLSVLLFGSTGKLDPLMGGRDLTPQAQAQNNEDTQIKQQATGFLSGQLLKRASGAISKELRLDVIQIESDKKLDDARVRIGKYLTPDVFVSVSQDFGSEGNRVIELEYDIPKRILFFDFSLQASQERSGDNALDLFWKVEW
jgi:autotransporter translocation and assembly factor TamB